MVRLKIWQLYIQGIASILYILEYLFVLLTASPKDYDYNVFDCIYYQWQCTVYLLIFISIYHSYRHQNKANRTIIFSALFVSIIRFITQGLEGLKIINAGELNVVIFNFFILILLVLFFYITHSKFSLWYKKQR